MFAIISAALRTPAAKTAAKAALGVTATATAAYLLRRYGGDKKVVEGVAKAGGAVTAGAVVATAAVLDGGCMIADGAISAASAAATGAAKATEAVGYGIGRASRAVLDVTASAGKATSRNPLSRGVMKGFHAPDAQVTDAPVVEGVVAAARG